MGTFTGRDALSLLLDSNNPHLYKRKLLLSFTRSNSNILINILTRKHSESNYKETLPILIPDLKNILSSESSFNIDIDSHQWFWKLFLQLELIIYTGNTYRLTAVGILYICNLVLEGYISDSID